MIGFIIGLFLGTIFGYFIAALIFVGSDGK